jgi:saccharopine dehydrogenase (NAD+, L-glutamate forming)
MDRPHDLVLFGATGYTGALTATYLARTAPPGLRWALAGRNRAKLSALRDELAAAHPAAADVPLLTADMTDPASVAEVAAATRVVASTVGPYLLHGEPLVAASTEHGTDYLDITGETEFVDQMYLRYHQKALDTGARLVHACGFDSLPHDLGTYFTVQQLPEGVPVHVGEFVRVSARLSGGTARTTVNALSRVRQSAQVAKQRRSVEPRPQNRRIRLRAGRPQHDRAAGGWMLPLPTLDPQIVTRSAAAIDRYGPDFSFSQYLITKRLATAAGLVVGVVGVAGLAQLPPTRRWLLGRWQSGAGPTPEERARGWFRLRFVGTGGGRRVVTEVSGGDPGYAETSMMVAESAMCLASDDLPATAGQVTSVVAMGDALTDRLRKAGITFNVLED